MSTSVILLERNFSANDVDIIVFEPCFLSFHYRGRLGGGIRNTLFQRKLNSQYVKVQNSMSGEPGQ